MAVGSPTVVSRWNLRRSVAGDVRSRLGAGRVLAIDDRANFFGLESAGVLQIRGNGCLAATQDAMLFLMWIPRKEIPIPRERITAVERTKWHLGKTFGIPLLRVRFTGEGGQADSAAWAVRDLPMWEAVLAA